MNPIASCLSLDESWRRRDERIAQLGVRGLVTYLRALPDLNDECAILDFGCGYFDAGLAIQHRVGRLDGFDVDDCSVAAARQRTARLLNTSIYSDRDEIPLATYDLIIAHSVFQYLGDDDEVTRTLLMFRKLLRPGGLSQVLLGDLIPDQYSSVKDAFRTLWEASKMGLFRPMIVHLYKSAFKSNGFRPHRISPERIVQMAADAGFHCERLPVNFTTSRQRYSCCLAMK